MMKEAMKISNMADLKVGMFDLGGGCFSVEAPDRREVRSVVAAILPNEQRAIGLCPAQKVLPWCYTALGVITQSMTSGREASAYIKRVADEKGIKLPALDFCLNYQGFGVAQGEAFLPTHTELRQISMGESHIRKSLRLIHERWVEKTLFSSTVNHEYCVWVQGFGNNYSHNDYQCGAYGVCPAVDIVLA